MQVFVLPAVGAIADRSTHKKHLLALFAYLGSAATVGPVFLIGDRYLLGAALLIIANVAFGASIVAGSRTRGPAATARPWCRYWPSS